MLEPVTLGSSPLLIKRLVLGGNVFGWTVDEKTSFEILDAFVDRGFNCVDTADVYSRFAPGNKGGESETILGKWFALGGGRRDRIVLCTKVGLEMGPNEKGLSAAYIAQAADASLQRLKTDHVDLYYSHADDPTVPLEETLGAYGRLIQAGKVRAIGASNYTSDRLNEALRLSETASLPRYECLQTLYNLYDRGAYEGTLEQVCVEQKVSVLPYFALASGFLTGKYRVEADFEKSSRAFIARKYLDARGLRILAAMDAIAAERQISLAQIALAWLLARPSVAAPIASATSLSQLNAMMNAVDIKLTEFEMQRLGKASDLSKAAG